MSAKECVRNAANQIAETAQERVKEKRKELAVLNVRKTQLESDIESVDVWAARHATFNPEIEKNLQCPDCWIKRGTQSELKPIQGTDTDDIFKCR